MIPYCSFVNNKVKIIRYQDKNSSRNSIGFLNEKFKKVMGKAIGILLVMLKKEVD